MLCVILDSQVESLVVIGISRIIVLFVILDSKVEGRSLFGVCAFQRL